MVKERRRKREIDLKSRLFLPEYVTVFCDIKMVVGYMQRMTKKGYFLLIYKNGMQAKEAD